MVKTLAKISFGALLCLALGATIFVYGVFSAVENLPAPAYKVQLASVPSVSALSWIVYDVELGDVLFSYNADAVLPIASVTKLATAAQFYATDDMQSTTTILWDDVLTEGRAGKLQYGEVYTNHELLFPLLLESSNDAAETLSRVDTSLLSRMNSYAKKLSLTHTKFADASGLSAQNVSTARELMVLSQNIYENQSHIIDITRLPTYYSEDNGWINTNPFINDSSYRGGKHGFTYDANRTTVSFFDEYVTGETVRTLGYVLLGSDDLTVDMDHLRTYVRDNTTYQ